MENAPVLQNLRKTSNPGLAEGIFSFFLIRQPIFDWLANGQKWSDISRF